MNAVCEWATPDGSDDTSLLRLQRARTPDQLDAAWHCTHECYVRRGLIAPHPLRMRMIPHHQLAATQVFCVLAAIADQRCATLGTLTLVDGQQMPLPMAKVFAREIELLRPPRARAVEATCLAIRDHAAPVARHVMRALMGMAAQAARLRGADRLLVAVHPRHARFYQREAGFVQWGPTRHYPLAGNPPAVPLQLDLMRVPIEQPAAHRLYFGMSLPAAAIAADDVPATAVAHARQTWQLLRSAHWNPQAA